MIEWINIKLIKETPGNPRFISDPKFKKLIKSIKDFPKMLEIRPIVVDENMVILGGNMRLKACKAAGMFEVPIQIEKGLSESEKKEFIIKDNSGFGAWDWDILANEWDAKDLVDWGVDIPSFDIDQDDQDENETKKDDSDLCELCGK